jgi:hypothetical protein
LFFLLLLLEIVLSGTLTLFFTRISRFDTPLALASLLLLLLLLFAELLFKWNGERKEKIKRKGKKRIERTRR